MRRSEEMPMDPDILAELEVIDLTLAGEPVDPEYAELAELALMLQMERSEPSPEFGRLLDARVNRRFATPASGAHTGRPGRWSWLQSPGFRAGLVGAMAAAALVVFVTVSPHGGSSSSSSTSPSAASTTSQAGSATGYSAVAGAVNSAAGSSSSTASSTSKPLASSQGPSLSKHAATKSLAPALSTAGSWASGAAAGGAGASGVEGAAAAPSPNTAGRKVVESAQMTLTAANNRIDTVSQEVFDVVSQEHGIVMSSHINSVAGKGGGTASFSLSIPTGNLEAALQSLSSLRYGHVVSRTNTTQDVTKTYRNDRQRLQDAQALRTSLLKQLAQATTQAQTDSLKAQLQDAERQISSAQYALNVLQHQVSFSSLSVQLYSGNPPIVKPVSSSGGFTLGGAAHDAGRVLVVAAGVILIGAAGLVPVALLALLALWVVEWLRRRRREQALDQT